MPMNRSKYPPNWEDIALRVKRDAGWHCQICGKPCRTPGEPLDTHQRTLTVAHLNHDESDCSDANLIAACAPCHCRYDARTKAEYRKYGLKTAYIYDDLRHVQNLTYNERRREYHRQHDRWPRGEENDRLRGMPDLEKYRQCGRAEND